MFLLWCSGLRIWYCSSYGNRLELQLCLDPWPGNFHMLQEWPKTKNKNKKTSDEVRFKYSRIRLCMHRIYIIALKSKSTLLSQNKSEYHWNITWTTVSPFSIYFLFFFFLSISTPTPTHTCTPTHTYTHICVHVYVYII